MTKTTDKEALHYRHFPAVLLHPFSSLGKEKLGTAVVISIIIASYVLFFVFQITSEFATLGEVFSSSRKEQFATAQSLAKITNLKFNIIEDILNIRSSSSGRISSLSSSPTAMETTNQTTKMITTATTISGLANAEEVSSELVNSVQQRLAATTETMAMSTTAGSKINSNTNPERDGAAEITIVDEENKVVESEAATFSGDEGSNDSGSNNNTNEPLFRAGQTLEYPWARNVQKFHIPEFSGSYEAEDAKSGTEVTSAEPARRADDSGSNDDNNNKNNDKNGYEAISFAQPLFYAGSSNNNSNSNSSSYAGMIILTLPASYLTEDYESAINSKVKEVALLDSDQLTYVMTTMASSASTSSITTTNNNSEGNNDTVNDESTVENDNNQHQHIPGALFGDDIKDVQSGDDPKSVIASDRFKTSGGDVVFRNSDGEFLLSGFPVSYYGKPQYLLIIESATSDFYARVEPILFQSRIQMFSILTATAVLTVIIASFISRNINLDRQVKEKTKELTESNNTIVAQKQQLEKANEELRHLDALKTQFIGIASHELKNPIQPIILYAEMAKYGDVEKDKAIDIILRQAQRLKQLSADILEVSRIDSNNLVLNKQKVRIGSLIQEIVKPYQIADTEKDRTITTTAAAGAIISVPPNAATSTRTDTATQIPNIVVEIDENTMMNIDALRISQVINNIIQNAIKFTTRGGTVTIRKRTVTSAMVSSTGGDATFPNKATVVNPTVPQSQSSSVSPSSLSQLFVEIIISDTGPGIPRELMPQLFGKFITRDVNGLNKHGTGLGLYISKAIIEAHGGQTSAYNNNDDDDHDDSDKDNGDQKQHKGASFRILLTL